MSVPPFHTHPDEPRRLVWCFFLPPTISIHQTSHDDLSCVVVAHPAIPHIQTSQGGSSGVLFRHPPSSPSTRRVLMTRLVLSLPIPPFHTSRRALLARLVLWLPPTIPIHQTSHDDSSGVFVALPTLPHASRRAKEAHLVFPFATRHLHPPEEF